MHVWLQELLLEMHQAALANGRVMVVSSPTRAGAEAMGAGTMQQLPECGDEASSIEDQHAEQGKTVTEVQNHTDSGHFL